MGTTMTRSADVRKATREYSKRTPEGRRVLHFTMRLSVREREALRNLATQHGKTETALIKEGLHGQFGWPA
jgi:hypothetical protein